MRDTRAIKSGDRPGAPSNKMHLIAKSGDVLTEQVTQGAIDIFKDENELKIL